MRSDGVGAECDSCAPAFWNATLPTVRDCVTDFETAKSRRGVQACPQPDRTQDDSKLLQTIHSQHRLREVNAVLERSQRASRTASRPVVSVSLYTNPPSAGPEAVGRGRDHSNV